jgi:hypothetical protein
LAVIKGLPRFSGSKFVFSPGKTAPSGFSRAKTRLDGIIARMKRGEPIAPWILHDIRRSAASGLAGLGVNLPVIERCLNLVSGSFAGIVGVYQRHNFAVKIGLLQPRRQAAAFDATFSMPVAPSLSVPKRTFESGKKLFLCEISSCRNST